MTFGQFKPSFGKPGNLVPNRAGASGGECLPRVASKFYKAVVQAILLYPSETWVLSKTALASLEGFHIRAAYRMVWKTKRPGT